MGTLRHFPDRHEAIKRYNDNRCPPGQCMLDPGRECAKTCRYAQTQAIVEARPLREVPIVIDELNDADPLAPARGILFGLALSAFLVVAAICIGYGIADLWNLFAWSQKP